MRILHSCCKEDTLSVMDDNLIGAPANHIRGFSHALDLFRRAAVKVPAYSDFLKKNSIDAERIVSPSDFALVPPVTKENYLKAYPLNELLWESDISHAHIISMSSGSSGTPFFWPRNRIATEQSFELCTQIVDNNFSTREKTTLIIVAFAMGTWIAGTYMIRALHELAELDHKITLITPGINKSEIIHILNNLAPYFEQVIITGYPPFVKDVLDDASDAKVDLTKLNISLLFAGENFSEQWRTYVHKLISKDTDLRASVGMYGTADAGIMGYENPFSVLTRKHAMDNTELFSELFPGTSILPTLVQYNPYMRYFESHNEYLLFTSDNALPLIRYKINDQGRILTGEDIKERLTCHGVSIPSEFEHYSHESDYVALYGRSDVSTTFYALDIFPENIKYGLEKPELQKYVTGKFIIRTEYDRRQRQSLHLYTELKRDVASKTTISDLIFTVVLESLRKYNSEYNKLYTEIGKAAYPRIHLLPFESPEFKINIKHRWTQKR